MPLPTPTTPNRATRRHPAAAAQPRRYADPAEAAAYLRVTTRTIRQMIADGRITGYRNGRKLVRVDLNEVDACMEAFGGGVSS